MVEFYVLQIRLGHITIDDVPIIFRNQVQAKLTPADPAEHTEV